MEHDEEPDVQEFFTAFLTYIGDAAPKDKIEEIRRLVDDSFSKDGNEMSKLLKEIADDFYHKGIANAKAE